VSKETSNSLSKLTESLSINKTKGDLGEYKIRQFLENYFPHSTIVDTSKTAGGGDILLVVQGSRIQIEVKNHSETTLKANHKKILSEFLEKARVEKDLDKIDAAILAVPSSSDIPLKHNLQCENIVTEKGLHFPVIYITNIIDNPGKISMGVATILRVLEINKEHDRKIANSSQMKSKIDILLKELNEQLKNIGESIKIKEKTIKTIQESIDIDRLRQREISETIGSVCEESVIDPIDVIVSVYREIRSSEKNVTKKELQKLCIERGIYDIPITLDRIKELARNA
jgi:hypothetical protein